MAGPVLVGALQLTVRLVWDAAVTAGIAGLPGASVSSSVTFTATATVSVPPLPSLACTVMDRVAASS